MERRRRLDVVPLRSDPEEAGEAEGPVLVERVRGEQPVDHPLALRGVAIGQERPDLIGPRQPAGEVDPGATEKGRVVGHRRGRDAERPQGREDGLVDEIATGFAREIHRALGHRDDQLHGDDPVEIAGDHHVSTGPVDHGQAGLVRASQLDGRGLGRSQHRPARHVLDRPVVEPRPDPDRDLGADGLDDLPHGIDHEVSEPSSLEAGRPRADPGQETLGGFAVPGKPHAPLVVDPACRLGEDQALRGPGEIDPTALQFVDDRLVITRGVATEEGQLETAPTDRRAVAGARVAARPGEDRNHLGVEIDRPIAAGSDQRGDEDQARPGHRRLLREACRPL